MCIVVFWSHFSYRDLYPDIPAILPFISVLYYVVMIYYSLPMISDFRNISVNIKNLVLEDKLVKLCDLTFP